MSCGENGDVSWPVVFRQRVWGKCPLPHHRRIFCRKRTISRMVSSERRRSKSSCSSRYMPSTRMRFSDGRTSKKVLCREVVFFLEYAYKFSDLVQTLLHLSKVVGECHVHHPFFAKCTEALFLSAIGVFSRNLVFCSKFCGYIMVQKYY